MEPLVLTVERVAEYQPLLGGGPQTCGMRSGCVALGAGQECGEHSTEGYEEALVILEGEGVARIESRGDLPVRGGNLVYIPPQTRHNVANTGTGLLRYIYIVAPAAEPPAGE
jgi:mannose-6-phosphate isomerase-like protein (cupin superfamily)